MRTPLARASAIDGTLILQYDAGLLERL